MMISTRGRYALRVLADLAEQNSENYITLREIAARQEISEKYLESIVKDLVAAGFLEGLRGKGGGYRLGKCAEDMKVFEVLCATEGTIVPVACLEEGCAPCPRAEDCRTLPMWKRFDDTASTQWKSILAERAAPACLTASIRER